MTPTIDSGSPKHLQINTFPFPLQCSVGKLRLVAHRLVFG